MLLVEVKYLGRKLIISAASVEIIDEPLQVHIVDVNGNKTVVDCCANEFYKIDVNGTTECSNPNIKRR